MKEDQAALIVKYFIDNFGLDIISGKKECNDKKEQLANKYSTEVLEVFTVFDRLCRYEKYFNDFIPKKESGISQSEAIEYHLRNYVQEFYILRERIHHIVDNLKKDLTYYNIKNTSEVETVLNHLKKNVDENFKSINDNLRQVHVHKKSISDYDLVRGKFFAQILSGDLPIPKDYPIDLIKISELHDEVIELSRSKYLNQALQNSLGLKKGKQFFAARFGYIFAELNGHNGDIFDLEAHTVEGENEDM